MKKILTTLAASLIMSGSAFANVGVSVQGLYYDASGKETLKDSSKETTKDDSGMAPIASVFMEGEITGGSIVGLELTPYSAKLADGSMTNDDDIETAGTNSVDVNLKNLVSLYIESPISVGADGSFFRAAINHATLETDETSSTGSTYGDESLKGVTLGYGIKRDLPTGDGFYKIIAEVSHFQGATFNSENTNNKIELDDFQTAAIRLSVGF